MFPEHSVCLCPQLVWERSLLWRRCPPQPDGLQSSQNTGQARSCLRPQSLLAAMEVSGSSAGRPVDRVDGYSGKAWHHVSYHVDVPVVILLGQGCPAEGQLSWLQREHQC
jgi:hypothetical protein